MPSFVVNPGRLLGIVLALLPLWAQAQAPIAAPGEAVLTGHISAPKTDSIAVALRENPLDPKEKVYRVRIDEKGDFRVSMPVKGGTKADLLYGEDVAALYLDPGTDVEVRFKGEDMANTLKFKPNAVPSGFGTKVRNGSNLTDEQRHRQQAANANNYLAENDAQFIDNEGFQVLPENIELYEAPFISFLEYRRKHEFQFLEDRAAKQSFTEEFYNYAYAEVVYSYANDRLTYIDLREQVVMTGQRVVLTPTYYDFLKDPLLYNNVKAVQSEQYHEFLLNYIHYLAIQAKHQRTDPDFYPFCYALAAKKLNGESRLVILGRVLQESFRFGHVKQSANMLADYQTYDPKKRYYSTLLADFDQHKTFAIGAPAPDFTLISATGDTVHLHDFAGKLVHLNFWKTTNGLSMRDLPFAQEMAKKFADKNIVFINIALDNNEQAWKQLVVSRKMPGVQLRATGDDLKAPVAQAYAIQEVPAYFLIAEDGTFLNTKPKRLSSHAAIEEINQAFGKAGTYSSVLEVRKQP